MDTINTKLCKYIKKLQNSTSTIKSDFYRKKIQYYRYMQFNKKTQYGGNIEEEITSKRRVVLENV